MSCLVQGRTCLFQEYENPHCKGHEVTIGCQVQFIKSDPMGGKVLRTGVQCPGCNATRSHCWRQLTLVRAGAGLRVISRLSQSVCFGHFRQHVRHLHIHPVLPLSPLLLASLRPHLPLPAPLQTLSTQPAVSVW